MPQPNIKALAVYRIQLSPELLEEALEAKYGGLRMSATESELAREQIIEEISSVALIELLVSNPDDHFNLSDFHQPGSDQAAYNEVYLSKDGQSVIPTRYFEVPKDEVFRVGFYLHYFDPEKPLVSSYGLVDLPPIQEMPDYIFTLIPYYPVD